MGAEGRFVFDTNTLVSAACFSGSFGRRAFDHVLDHATFVTCNEAIDELINVIFRAKFERFSPRTERAEFIDIFLVEAEVVPITGTLKICRDPTDDKFLELALAGRAQFIVTRDKDLLVLDPFRGVQIVDAESLVALLAAPTKGG